MMSRNTNVSDLLNVYDMAQNGLIDLPNSPVPILVTKDGEIRGEEDEPPSEEMLKKHEEESKPGCGSCYGAESDQFKCCNSCEDVQNAYASKNWEFANPENIRQVRVSRAVAPCECFKSKRCVHVYVVSR